MVEKSIDLSKATLGVLLTRGQVFTNGHYGLVKLILDENDYACVVIGSADKQGTERNPFPIELREQFINISLYDLGEDRERVAVFPLNDWISENNATELNMWGHYLYYNIVGHTGIKRFKFYYSDGEEVLNRWFDDEVRQYIKYVCNDRSKMFGGVSATQVRELLLKEDYASAEKLISPCGKCYMKLMHSILKEVMEGKK